MIDITTFKVFNDTGCELEIIHEPEVLNFNLPSAEQITIESKCCLDSLQLRISLENGKVILSVLDEKSLYKVFYKGNDVFEQYLF